MSFCPFRQQLSNDLHVISNDLNVRHVPWPSPDQPVVCNLCSPGRSCDIHQMTGNYMWDEISMKEFLIGTNPDSRLPLWWDGSEPIWVTMEKEGKNVVMYYWPGAYEMICSTSIPRAKEGITEKHVNNCFTTPG